MRGRTIRTTLVVAAAGAAIAIPWADSATAGGGGGCHRGMTQGTGGRVEMVDMCFTPSILQAEPGTEVTFANEDPMIHNVSASADWGHPDAMRQGDSFSATFSEEGIYPFACSYHPGMTGAVVVGDGTGPGSGARVTAGPSDKGGPVAGTAPVSTEGSGAATGWVGGGILGVLVGSGLGLALRRKPTA